MTAHELGPTPQEWQERIGGRGKFDASAAEAAVRGLYGVSGLGEPRHVLLADGPTEAAQLLDLVRAPPRTQRHRATLLSLVGAAMFAAMALATELRLPTDVAPTNVAFWVTMGGIMLVTASQRIVPLGSQVRLGRPGLGSIGAGCAIAATMICYALVLQSSWARPDTIVGRIGIVILGAVLGTLPGALFRRRLSSAYLHIPAEFGELRASASVASKLRSAQLATIWPGGDHGSHRRIDQSQVWVRDHAHLAAFVRNNGQEAPSSIDMDRPPVGIGWESLYWPPGTAPNQVPTRTHIPHIPGFLNTFEHAAQFPVLEKSSDETAAIFVRLAFSLDRLYPFRETAVGVRPATLVATDTEGRVHAETGPALAWTDGTRVFAWHGHPVPSDVLDSALPVTRARIGRTADPVARRALIDRYGLARYVQEAGARELQRDEYGALYYLDQPFDEPIVVVRVRNATPAPDGQIEEFWLRVPPGTRTAHEGVAWTFGLGEREYQPSTEA